MLNKIKNQKAGFTIIELMVSVAIVTVIVYICMDYLLLAFKAARYSDEQQEAVTIARNSMDIITKEIRGANSSEQGGYPLSFIEDDEIIFFSDIDDDNIYEKIRYFVSGITLTRVINEPGALNDYNTSGTSTSIADYINNISEPIFIYYDDNHNETDIINNVRLIQFNLKINVTPAIAPNDVYVKSEVNLRNLKDNL